MSQMIPMIPFVFLTERYVTLTYKLVHVAWYLCFWVPSQIKNIKIICNQKKKKKPWKNLKNKTKQKIP